MILPTSHQLADFRENGFLILDRFIDPNLARSVADRYPSLFRGEFETTVPPDEWRWVEGRDPTDVTRMIWNGWKSDRTVASLALSEQVGLWCAQLSGWSGARLNQDGCIWKPPGATGLAFHQDASYNQWIVPSEVITCWIALDDVEQNSGSIEYVRGSHRWGVGPKPTDFHRPEDHRAMVKLAAQESGYPLEITTARIPAGGATFHHGWLWHGSGTNQTQNHRRVLALHLMPKDVAFHPTLPAYAQGRYRRFGSTEMEESFYPILWGERGERSAWIKSYLQSPSLDYRSHAWRKE